MFSCKVVTSQKEQSIDKNPNNILDKFCTRKFVLVVDEVSSTRGADSTSPINHRLRIKKAIKKYIADFQ